MTTFATPDTGKAIVQDAAIEESVNDAAYVGPKKAILALKAPFINLLEGLKMILHTLVVGRACGVPGPINHL